MWIREENGSSSQLCVPEALIAQRDSLFNPDAILDGGAAGLAFFFRFHGAASRLGIECRPIGSYGETYRSESGIDLAALSADVSKMVAAAQISSRDSQMLTELSDSLPDVWNVVGAGDVSGRVRDVRQQAEADDESMSFVVSVADELAHIVRTALVDKAFKVASLDREIIGGVDAQGIDQLVDVCWAVDRVEAVAKAATWFAPVSDMRFRSVQYGTPTEQVETCRAAADIVQPWIDRVFVKVYLDTRDEFDRACAECRVALIDAFDIATGLATELFPVPSGSAGGSRPVILQDSSPEPVQMQYAAEPLLELAVGANTWGFSVAQDGRGVSLEIRDPVGESVTVTMELDQNGWPRIVVDTDLDTPAGSDSTSRVDASSVPPEVPAAVIQPEPVVPPEPPYQLPDPVPLDPEPLLDKPVDTGAELAGAGPI